MTISCSAPVAMTTTSQIIVDLFCHLVASIMQLAAMRFRNLG